MLGGPEPQRAETLRLYTEGAALLTLVEGDAFDDAWLSAVSELGRSVTDAPPSDGSLSGRVEEVRALAHQRRVLGDALATAVERAFVEQSLRMLGSVDAIAPGRGDALVGRDMVNTAIENTIIVKYKDKPTL